MHVYQVALSLGVEDLDTNIIRPSTASKRHCWLVSIYLGFSNIYKIALLPNNLGFTRLNDEVYAYI